MSDKERQTDTDKSYTHDEERKANCHQLTYQRREKEIKRTQTCYTLDVSVFLFSFDLSRVMTARGYTKLTDIEREHPLSHHHSHHPSSSSPFALAMKGEMEGENERGKSDMTTGETKTETSWNGRGWGETSEMKNKRQSYMSCHDSYREGRLDHKSPFTIERSLLSCMSSRCHHIRPKLSHHSVGCLADSDMIKDFSCLLSYVMSQSRQEVEHDGL